MDHRMQVNAHLFDILSGRTAAEHPMCQECADILIHTQHQLLNFQSDELTCLQNYLSQMNPSEQDDAPIDSAPNSLLPSKHNFPDHAFDDTIISNGSHSSKLHTPDDVVPENEILLDVKTTSSVNDCSASDKFTDEISAPESRNCSNVKSESNCENSSPIKLAPEYGNSSESTCLLHSPSDPFSNTTVASSEENEYAMLEKELVLLMEESVHLDKKIESDSVELNKRKEYLERATNEYNRKKLLLIEAEESLSILDARLSDARHQFDRLRKTNVLNAAFPIWYDGHIGLINGLHLGRLPNKPIEWSEINAAWGQCTLLLQCLAKQFSFTFQHYSLVAMGNQSQIVNLSNDRSFPLYNSTGSIRLFNTGKFDTALSMFLDCVGQLQSLVEKPPEFNLPYKILDKGRLLDTDDQVYSIKYSNNNEENWTKSLKMLLIDLKWIIAASVSRRKDDKDAMNRPQLSNA